MSKTEHSVLEPMMAEHEAYYERDGEIVHALSTCVTDKKHKRVSISSKKTTFL